MIWHIDSTIRGPETRPKKSKSPIEKITTAAQYITWAADACSDANVILALYNSQDVWQEVLNTAQKSGKPGYTVRWKPQLSWKNTLKFLRN